MKAVNPVESTESTEALGATAVAFAARGGGVSAMTGSPSLRSCVALHGRDSADAEQLYSVLGLLIIEGRAPEASEKGRVMGPHVKALPMMAGGCQGSGHVCDQTFNKQCLRAAFYEEELSKYGRHLVPISVEVLLLSDCGIHANEEPNQRTPTKDQYCLLEQWIIRVMARSGRSRLESLSAVLQAVTSYLHFSQLSAWYIQTRGARPRHILYRLSVPGESSLSLGASSDLYEARDFPRMPVGSAHYLELSVLALRRQPAIPSLPCRLCGVASGLKKRPADAGATGGAVGGGGAGGWKDRRSRLTLPLSESSYFKAVDSPKVICSELHGAPERSKSPFGASDVREEEVEEEEGEDVLERVEEAPGGLAEELHTSEGRAPVPAKRLKFFYRQTSSEKDLTPFPRPGRNNLEAVVNEFARLNLSSAPITPVPSSVAPAPPPSSANGAAKSSRFPAASAPSSAASSAAAVAAVASASRKKKRERTILFSDSSSTESLERIAPSAPPRPPALSQGGPGVGSSRGSLFSSQDSLESLVLDRPPPPPSPSPRSELESVEVAPKEPTGGVERPEGGAAVAKAGVSSTPTFGLFDDSSADEGPEERSKAAGGGIGAVGMARERSPSASPPARRRRNTNSAGGAGLTPYPLRDRLLRRRSDSSALFHRRTGLPTNSSPAPLKRRNGSNKFDYDPELATIKTVKSAICMSVDSRCVGGPAASSSDSVHMSASAPATAVSSRLVVNFEESLLNGRLDPVGVVDGFELELAAAGSFCPKHVRLPVVSYFYKLSEDNAPSPYLGYVDITRVLGKRGYRVPKKGTLQLTLFNPQGSVLKMFVVLYDFADMPRQSQTFLRQRTLYMPVVANDASPQEVQRQRALPSYLRYIVHLRFHTSRSAKLFLHTDIRLVFPRDKFEFDPRVATYELKSFTECPQNPRYSPKK